MWIDRQTVLLLKNTIQQDGWIELPSFGNSMYPIIRQGEVCRFSTFKPSAVRKGDILLFYTPSEQLIAHRFYKQEKSLFVLKGDSNLGYDEPIEEEQIIGKLTVIYKKNKMVRIESGLPVLWGNWIMTFPILSVFLQKYVTSNFHVLRSSR